ncbi:hypothetical protein E4U43_005885 [Claviceps pusilla]|uniref:Uncharacterized protein n=1 Tax=Claviceps pusilla TaxID=123648 RepID=A0A9P7NED1_9HYPO|nr:hypothetical protein E4U43_005885 [Claviceps pusilla]
MSIKFVITELPLAPLTSLGLPFPAQDQTSMDAGSGPNRRARRESSGAVGGGYLAYCHGLRRHFKAMSVTTVARQGAEAVL